MHPVDQVELAFNASSLFVLNIVLGLVMFGVALDLSLADFARIVRRPRAPLVGLLCQFLLLPALTFLLVSALQPTPSIALGMMLVAACPGGNVSNYLTQLARGDLGTSVSMTAVSTSAALVMTPVNVALWGSMHPATAAILTDLRLDPVQMLVSVSMLLGIPVVLGMTIAAQAPGLAARLRRPFRIGSLLFFVLFVVAAFHANFDHFLAYVGLVFVPVALMNGTALALGWGAGRLAGLSPAERRATSIEVGIQNSGLGLLLVFNFFGGLGGMAVVTAWWGIWHLVAGLTVAGAWSRIDPGPSHAALPGTVGA